MSASGLGPFHTSTSALSPASRASLRTSSASLAESFRKPWSTVRTTGAGRLPLFAQWASSSIKATESPPRKPATAPGQGAASAAMAATNRAGKPSSACGLGSAAGFFAAGLAAGGGFVLLRGARDDGFGGVRVFRREGGKGGTAFLLLVERDQRLTELEHAFRRPRARGIFLELLDKSPRRGGVVLLHIGNIADPVYRLRRQFILGIGVGEGAEGAASLVILRLGEQVHRRLELGPVGAGCRSRRERRSRSARRAIGRQGAEHARRRRQMHHARG